MPFSTLKDVEVVHDALITQCERLNDRFALLDSPFPSSTDRTREYRMSFDTRYAALYFPWIVTTRRGRRIEVPPSGHVAGIIARCDEAMGVHRAPANEVLEGAEDLALALRDEDVGYLNSEGINCLKAVSGRGLRVWGARAMSSDPEWRFLNVRRVINAINKAMLQNLQWVVFEPNLPSLWKSVTRNVTDFMMDLWRKGFFTGALPEHAFFVKCDDETNPPEERAAGRMIVEVGVAPVRPAEFITLRLAQEMQETTSG
jgi:phage tail sheath protein FI